MAFGISPSVEDYRGYCGQLYHDIMEELQESGQCPLLKDRNDSFRRALITQDYWGAQYVKIRGRELAEYLAVQYTYASLVKSDSQKVRDCLNGRFADGHDLRWNDMEKVEYRISVPYYVFILQTILDTAADRYQRQNAGKPYARGNVHSIPVGGGGGTQRAAETASREKNNGTVPTPEASRAEAQRLKDGAGAPDAEAKRLLEAAQQKNAEAEKKRQEADRLLEQIRSELGRRSSLEEEIQALSEENDQSRNLLEQAKEIIAAARSEAERIAAAARSEAEGITAAAGQRAEEITAEAENAAKENAAALVRRYLRSEVTEGLTPETVFPTDEAELLRLSKEAAVEGAYQVERNLRNQLDNFKYQLQDQLNDWRRNLYGQEYGPLADFYQTLYRQLGSGSKTAQAIATEIGRISALEEPSEQDRDLLRRLNNLQKELSTLVTQLGKVMGSLGLEIVLPAEGEVFDRELHIDEEAESGFETVNGVIDRVRFPAVCGRDSAGYRIPIRPAAVTVKAIEPEEQK